MTISRQVEPVSYTINDAVAALGIGRTKIYQLIDNGTLRKIKGWKTNADTGQRRAEPY